MCSGKSAVNPFLRVHDVSQAEVGTRFFVLALSLVALFTKLFLAILLFLDNKLNRIIIVCIVAAPSLSYRKTFFSAPPAHLLGVKPIVSAL